MTFLLRFSVGYFLIVLMAELITPALLRNRWKRLGTA